MASSRVPALTDISVPDLADRSYIVDTSDTTDDASGSSRDVGYDRLFGQLLPKFCDGRLTLTTGVPVTTADVLAATNVFFTPYLGNLVSLYDGTRWKLYVFTERTLAVGTLTSGKNYDVFLYDNSGTLTLEFSAAWTNDTTRADALTTQDAVPVKSGATTRRWVGTVRTVSTTTVEDSALNRFCWSTYHRVERHLDSGFISDVHGYTTGSWREWNAGTNSVRVKFLLGDLNDPTIKAAMSTRVINGSTTPAQSAPGLNSTTTPLQFGTSLRIAATFDTQSFGVAAARVGLNEIIPLELGDASNPAYQFYEMAGLYNG